MEIKEKITAQLPEYRERVRKLVKENGDVKVGDVSIAQVYGGARGVRMLVTDISYVDPDVGIRLRGYTISAIWKISSSGRHFLPKLYWAVKRGSAIRSTACP
ncbi:unnamed protein product [marine sediment metagenome]|uniref:Uncharacterized protein n=1 Tax=marine sediment metagenome TaxID=412755 RepID=X1K4X5_9ZZZZ